MTSLVFALYCIKIFYIQCSLGTMDRTFEIAYIEFKVAEIEELLKIKEKRVRILRKNNKEKTSMHNLTKTHLSS